MNRLYSNVDALREHQWKSLQALLATVIPANPFYTRKLRNLCDLSTINSLESFSARLPFTTKAELSEDYLANPPYGSNLTFPIERYTRCHQTSGSSGQPMRWLDTNESWSGLLDNWNDVYVEARVTPADRIFFAFSFGPFLGFWTAFEAATRIGCFCVSGGGMSSDARLQAMLENHATVLCCTPTYAMRLAQVARQEGIDLKRSQVRLIIVAGEPGGSVPATRNAISNAWNGARVFDHHGMTEVGPVSHECFDHPGTLRIIESAYFPEIIDPQTGHPVPEGQSGELVLTTLNRTASPLIRYRTGDLVTPISRDQSPTGFADLCLAGGILGRVDDMVLIRGVNVYPAAVEAIVNECSGVVEHQARIREERGLTVLELVIETMNSDPEDVRQRLESLLQRHLLLRVPVIVAEDGSLPRFEFKARRWLREVAAPKTLPEEQEARY